MRSSRLSFIVAALFMSISVAVLGVRLYQTYTSPPPTILASCAGTNGRADEAYDTCLRNAANTLLNTYSTQQLLAYITATSTPQPIQNHCHEIAHAIGEETFAKSGNTEEAFGQCTNACDNGCMHGVVAQSLASQLGSTKLSEDVVHADVDMVLGLGKTYCAKSITLCHAMGHILYIAENDIDRALTHCDAMNASASASKECYQGVFMEASGEDAGNNATFVKKPLSSVSQYTYDYPCAGLPQRYLNACFTYLPIFQKAAITKQGLPLTQWFDISLAQCKAYSDDQRYWCFKGVGFWLGGSATESNRCTNLESMADRESCSDGVALRYSVYAHFDTAIQYCATLSDAKAKTSCYHTVFTAAAGLRRAPDTIYALCPTADQQICANEKARILKNSKS